MPGFIGRQAELQRLVETTQKRSASFIVVRGRRRIGKSRLIEEFAQGFSSYYVFAGLPPEKNTTAKHQLDEFSRQLARQFRTAPAQYQDWSDALWAVGERVRSGKVLLCFDEISWMGSKDPNFLGKIKNAWDQQFKKNDRLVFVVCGSASSWIEENLLSGTGFVGRISYTMTLEELPLPECDRFWPDHISAYEKFKVLSVTGGVPKYLEEIDPKRSAEENIKRLCFTRGGFLVEEFEQVFTDIFLRDSEFYRKILEIVCASAQEMPAIKSLLTGDQHGRVSER
jgi:AAA+ ATPase superfamily predicted ATPase